jgi:hypothetical protein
MRRRTLQKSRLGSRSRSISIAVDIPELCSSIAHKSSRVRPPRRCSSNARYFRGDFGELNIPSSPANHAYSSNASRLELRAN